MPAEPSIEGLPDVGDRQQIWWGRYGTPSGTPAVVLQGGSGPGCADQWRWFDLERPDDVQADSPGWDLLSVADADRSGMDWPMLTKQPLWMRPRRRS